MYTQLFGMWLLPIAWGLTWRAVSKGKGYALTAIVLALTIATHLMTGYLALLTIGVWVLLRWRGILSRIGRAAIVAIGGLATAAWVMVPLFADRNYSAQTEYYKGTIFNDSYGAGKIIHWLRTGELFDHGRFPIFTLLAVGFVMCVIRAPFRSGARAAGRVDAQPPSVLRTDHLGFAREGPARQRRPADAPVHGRGRPRGVLLAGVGLAAVAQLAAAGLTRGFGLLHRGLAKPAIVWGVVAVAVVAALAPAWSERARYDLDGGTLITYQRAYEAHDGADFKALVLEAERLGGGRIYAGMRARGVSNYRIGSVQAFAELEDYDADTVGYPFRTIQSLSTDIDASFDDAIPRSSRS